MTNNAENCEMIVRSDILSSQLKTVIDIRMSADEQFDELHGTVKATQTYRWTLFIFSLVGGIIGLFFAAWFEKELFPPFGSLDDFFEHYIIMDLVWLMLWGVIGACTVYLLTYAGIFLWLDKQYRKEIAHIKEICRHKMEELDKAMEAVRQNPLYQKLPALNEMHWGDIQIFCTYLRSYGYVFGNISEDNLEEHLRVFQETRDFARTGQR